MSCLWSAALLSGLAVWGLGLSTTLRAEDATPPPKDQPAVKVRVLPLQPKSLVAPTVKVAPAAGKDKATIASASARTSRTVHVEVFLVEVTAKADAEIKGLERSDLTGPAPAVLARVRGLQKQGVVVGLKHIRLTTLEAQTAKVQQGESRPMVTGIGADRVDGFGGRRGGSGGMRSISYQATGTVLEATPEVLADGSVLLKLLVQDSRMRTPQDGVSLGSDEKGEAIRAAEPGTLNVETTLRLWPGSVSLVEGMKASSRAGQVQEFVLVAVSLE